MTHSDRATESRTGSGAFGGPPLTRQEEVAAEPVVESFIKARGLSLPVGVGPTSNFRRYGVVGIPVYTLVDAHGVVRSQSNHLPEVADIRALTR